MNVYFDSSALVVVYVTEKHSVRARREARRQPTVPWTPLHDLEVKNALRLLHGRCHLDPSELQGLIAHVDNDLNEGRLARLPIDLDTVFHRAQSLSDTYTPKTLAPTLDILHVAALLELGCKKLVSGDSPQIPLAKAEGIRTIDIKAP